MRNVNKKRIEWKRVRKRIIVFLILFFNSRFNFYYGFNFSPYYTFDFYFYSNFPLSLFIIYFYFQGIQALFKAAKKDREFSTIGGDVLLLIRSLAVTTIGEHKLYAVSCFKEVSG